MEMVPKSKRKRSRPSREFIVNNGEARAVGISESTAADRKMPMEAAPEFSSLTGITADERHQLIAQAAYFRAERRNFSPGCELEDWLSAESEIERKLLNIGAAGLPKDI